jgi:hypothetical protein
VGTSNAARAASTRDKRGRRLRACLTVLQELPQKSQRRASSKTGGSYLLRADRFLRQKSCAKFFTLALTDDQRLSYTLKREAIRQARRTEGILILKSDSTTLNAEEIVRGYRS